MALRCFQRDEILNCDRYMCICGEHYFARPDGLANIPITDNAQLTRLRQH